MNEHCVPPERVEPFDFSHGLRIARGYPRVRPGIDPPFHSYKPVADGPGPVLEQPDRLRAWALRLEKKIGHNKAAVALANKMTRIAWAVWKSDRDFEPVPETKAA